MKGKIEHPFYLQIDEEIKRVDEKADRYRTIFYVIRIGLIVFASLITVAIGAKGFDDLQKTLIPNSVLILGVLTTALTGIDSLFQFETKKNTYKLMLTDLRELRSEIVFYHILHTEEELKQKIRTELFPKYQTIKAYSRALIEKEKEQSLESAKKPTEIKDPAKPPMPLNGNPYAQPAG